MIRLLSMDLDDTLLRSDKTISPFTLDVLDRCREKGVLTAFNTARGEIHCTSLIEQAKPDFVISSSGAMITRGGERVDVMPLTPAQTRRLIDLGRKENCPITVDTAGDYFCNDPDYALHYPAGWSRATYSDFSDFREPGLKICMELPNSATAARIAAEVDCDWLGFAGGNWYKFTRHGATKEGALERLGARTGIAWAEMAAFGDDFSDIGSLKRCGFGIAMANAIPEVRQAADGIAASNDSDGVARWIEQNVLKD